MEQLTIGQRIAEERKKQNLSQMGLAARLEVSRQAISKWESDAAIPEIDKLITLSRLFGVSVGWLLGVEESTVPQENVLAEEQYKVVEELVKKYQMPPKPHLTVYHYILAFGASLMIFLLMYGRMEQFEQYSKDIASLTERIEKLESQSISSSNLPVNTLLANYSLTPAAPVTDEFPSMGRGVCTVSLSAIPHNWHPDREGWLYVQSGDGENREVQCLWDGSSLTANIQLPVADGYAYSFVVKHPDGSQEAQILPEETARNLQSTFHIPGVHENGTIEYRDGTLILRNYHSTLSMPDIYQQERFEEPGYYSDPYSAVWQKAEYVLLVNDSASGAAYYRLPVVDHAETGYPEEAFSGTLILEEPELRFEGIQVTDTTMHAQLWLYTYLDNGVRERYLLNMFDYSQELGFTELP